MKHCDRTQSLERPKQRVNFVANFTAKDVGRGLVAPKHKILMEEDKRVKEVIMNCAPVEPPNDFYCSEWDIELMESELRRLEKYMRSRWSTVLCALKQILPERRKSKKVLKKNFIKALREVVKEKMLYEVTNMSLARIKRSSTPSSDIKRTKTNKEESAGILQFENVKTIRKRGSSTEDTEGGAQKLSIIKNPL